MKKIKILAAVYMMLILGTLSAQNNKGIKIYPDIVYGHKYGMALTLDVYQPGEANGAAIIFFNSGGFQSPFIPNQYETKGKEVTFIKKIKFNSPPFMEQFSFENLLEAGYIVFDLRHGSAPKFMLDEIVQDCDLAFDFIVKNASSYKVDAGRIGLWGASAGGYLAAYIGYKRPNTSTGRPKAVCLYFPAGYDLLKFPELQKAVPSLNIKDEILDKLSLKNFISSENPPSLILYGGQDSDFIKDPSLNIKKDLDSFGVESRIVEYPNTGHVWMGKDGKFNSDVSYKAMAELIKWFDRYLK